MSDANPYKPPSEPMPVEVEEERGSEHPVRDAILWIVLLSPVIFALLCLSFEVFIAPSN